MKHGKKSVFYSKKDKQLQIESQQEPEEDLSDTSWKMETVIDAIKDISTENHNNKTTPLKAGTAISKIVVDANKKITDSSKMISDINPGSSCQCINCAVMLDDAGHVSIDVHDNTANPHKVWENELQKEVGNVVPVKQVNPETSIPQNCIRFVCISDTHSRVERSDFAECVPQGDVLLHAGDFTLEGSVEEFGDFNKFLGELPHRIKLVIPGNHEVTLDPRGSLPTYMRRRAGLSIKPEVSDSPDHIEAFKKLVSNAKILIDSQVEICGIKIYGSPWVPIYGSWAFGLDRGIKLLKKYNKIPAGIDILMSHGPPVGFGDVTARGEHVGCVELLNSVRHRIKPKYLVNGHVHEGYGIRTDGTTTYINAAVCNKIYRPVHEPIVFDFPLPAPYTREDFLKLQLKDLS